MVADKRKPYFVSADRTFSFYRTGEDSRRGYSVRVPDNESELELSLDLINELTDPRRTTRSAMGLLESRNSFGLQHLLDYMLVTPTTLHIALLQLRVHLNEDLRAEKDKLLLEGWNPPP